MSGSMDEELYQAVVLEHARRPRNHGPLDHASVKVEADNPLCGDELTLWLRVEGTGETRRIEAAGFQAQACAICTASASLMTQKIKGLSTDAVRGLAKGFLALATGGQPGNPDAPPEHELGELAVLAGVRHFPLRVKCATLPWHALEHALDELEQGALSNGSSKEGRVSIE